MFTYIEPGSGYAEIWLWGAGIGFAAMFFLNLLLLAFDARKIDEESVWAKPLKFELSLSIHFLTLAILTARLSETFRHSDILYVTAVAAVMAAVFEIAYIVFRAARRETSHFNVKTPLAGLMYMLMAVGAVIITIAASILGVMVLMDAGFRDADGLRIGVAIGLIGGTILTLITAFTMGGALSHHVGIEPENARRMPLTGWSLSVGDRRPAHFAATHMMQALPVAGLICDLCFAPPFSAIAIISLSIVYILITVWIYRRANKGLPLFGPRGS